MLRRDFLRPPSRTAHGASEASTGERALTLAKLQQAEARGYRSQSLSFSSACLINGKAVTRSCWSRSAVLS